MVNVYDDLPQTRHLLMGNEAIARGAIEAGVQVAASYPGTPGSEILETLAEAAKPCGFYAEWSTNEMVAFEVAMGAALVGARSIFSCKNAGLNVVMDALMTVVYGGNSGGFVVACADDPNAFYSSTEQDTRVLAKYAAILCFEPGNQQEAKDMTKNAFDLSESLRLPVFVRSITRLSHASGDVTFGQIRKEKNPVFFDKHWGMPYRWNVYGPPGPVDKHRWLIEQQPKLETIAEKSKFNKLQLKQGAKIGIIASGMGYSFTKEALEKLGLLKKVNLLKLGIAFPIPTKKVTKLLKACKDVLIVEEGDPVVEDQVRSLAKQVTPNVSIKGKTINPVFKRYGDLTPDIVDSVIATFTKTKSETIPTARKKLRDQLSKKVASRSSMWCDGCPHIGSFYALKKALRKAGGKVWITNVGIGCYEMSGYGIFGKTINPTPESTKKSKRYPSTTPYEFADTIYVMGSETGLPQGQFHAGYKDGKVVGVLGDSSFFHGNLPAIANAAYNKANILIFILDNYWTCMTGHQPNPATGITAMGDETVVPKIEDVCRSLGIEFVEVSDPYKIEEATETLIKAIQYEGPSVVVLRGLCALQQSREWRRQKYVPIKYQVDPETCNGCKTCVRLGCPSINFDPKAKKASINEVSCTGCKICPQVCPEDAIHLVKPQ